MIRVAGDGRGRRFRGASLRHDQAGFTLLELLVVIAIFGVFALMAYGGLDSVLNTRKRVEGALDQTSAYQKAYMRLRNDFQQVRNRPARDGYGDAQPALRWDKTSGNARVEFTRGGWRNPLYQPRPSLERVSYRLDERKLVRESFRVLDQAQDSKVVALTLLEDVDDLKWEFMDTEGSWHDSWPPDANTNPDEAGAPIGVQMTMTTKGLGKLSFVFRIGMDPVKVPPSASENGPGGTTTCPPGQVCEKPDPPVDCGADPDNPECGGAGD